MVTGNAFRRSVFAWTGLFLVLPALVPAATAAGSMDAPYAKAGKHGWVVQWAESSEAAAPSARRELAAVGDHVVIPGVGGLPPFPVRLRDPATAPVPDEVKVPADAALFVVADTHGEYEILVEFLRNQKIVDTRLRWSFGNGHLVFLGDVFDRGAHQTEILWLIYKLEAEAAAAGGGVHLLLGNHEAMVLRGDVRYLNAKYPRTAEALDAASYSELFGADTLLGQWLRSKQAMLKFNDFLLLHGGISPGLVERRLALADVNRIVRDVLNGTAAPDRDPAKFVMGTSGPLWYRGYFPREDAPAAATAADVDATLRHFGVDAVLVGHTPVPTVTPLYDGKVIAVQVYPHRDEATGAAVIEGVVWENAAWHRARIDGVRERLLPEVAPSP